jgi:hypothetical protein
MDPFIETCGAWPDFHDSLIGEIQRVVAPGLPEGYIARLQKRSYVVVMGKEEREDRPFLPDVTITAPRGSRRAGGTVQEALAAEEGEVLRAFIAEEFEELFLDIYEAKPERRLVTSVEVLSPGNKKKKSPGRKLYLRKRQALLLGNANLVEIDLLRGGERMPMLDDWPDSPYTVLVARDTSAPRCRVWRAYFDRPLPTVPVPLESPHPDIPLALQPLVDAVYQRSRYDEDIDYRQPLTPPLTAEEATWLEGRLREPAGKRASGGKRGKRRSGKHG